MIDVIYRSARWSDVTSIAQLINGYAAERIMLPKSADAIALSIEDFVVATDRHGRLLGCAALREYAPSLAEVASVAVARHAQGLGIGRQLVERVEALGAARGIEEVFALTLTTPFFEGMGYGVVDRARFPEKICRDCVVCPRRMACDEICVSKELGAAELCPTDQSSSVYAASTRGGAALDAGAMRTRRDRKLVA